MNVEYAATRRRCVSVHRNMLWPTPGDTNQQCPHTRSGIVNNFPTSDANCVDTEWVEVDNCGALWGNWLFATHL